MDSQLEELALIAAAIHKPLRATLDANDFCIRNKLILAALKDGKSKESRKAVSEWLARLGVQWNESGPIGEAIIESFNAATARKRAITKLQMAVMSLRYPNIAGVKTQAESLKLAATVQEYLDAIPKKEKEEEHGDGQ
jgi:hypothetical protein